MILKFPVSSGMGIEIENFPLDLPKKSLFQMPELVPEYSLSLSKVENLQYLQGMSDETRHP